MMNRSRTRMDGTSKVGCVVWLVLFAAVVYVSAQIIPIKVRTSEFYDAMQEQASFGSIKGDKAIQDELNTKARELNLPLKKEDIKVFRDATSVHVEVHYEISVAFPGYTYVWKEDRLVTRPLFAV